MEKIYFLEIKQVAQIEHFEIGKQTNIFDKYS